MHSIRQYAVLGVVTGFLLVGCSSPTTPPPSSPIKITSIQNNQEVSSNAPVIGEITTEKPVKKLIYKVNSSAEVDVSSGIQKNEVLQTAVSPQAMVTKFSFSISSEKFNEGKNTITIIIELDDGTRYNLVITVIFNPDKPPVAGRDIVVFNDNNFYSGDTNGGSIKKLPITDPNNIKFMKNLFVYTTDGVRQTSKKVWLYRGHESNSCKGECDNEDLTQVKNIIVDAGMQVQMSDSDPALTTIPADVKVLMMMMPATSFSTPEINVMKKFATEGGRIVFVGEHAGFYGSGGIATENDFLSKMGAVMRNEGNSVDCLQSGGLPVTLPGTSIRTHQITTGVPSLSLACSSVVTPGPNDFPLFFSADNTKLLGAVAAIDLTPLPAD